MDWLGVWSAVDARREYLGWLKADLYRNTETSEGTYRKMAAGIGITRAAKRAKISRALGWSPDSIDRMLRGEDPIVVTSAAVITERPDIVSGTGGVVSQPYVTADQLAALQEQVDRLQLALERLAKLSAQGAAKARSRSRVRRDSGQSS